MMAAVALVLCLVFDRLVYVHAMAFCAFDIFVLDYAIGKVRIARIAFRIGDKNIRRCFCQSVLRFEVAR